MAATETDDPALKERLHATSSAGDHARIAEHLAPAAEEFLDRQGVVPGERLLDIACGSGRIAIPAARRGARATGVDIVDGLLRPGAAGGAPHALRARRRGGPARRGRELRPGDQPDRRDVRPNPDLAASAMLRACRPGGRIGMGNWTPDGFIGEFFRTVGAHVPPMPSPLLWGREDVVRERLGDGVRDIEAERTTCRFGYPMPPAAVVGHFRRHFGPVVTAMEKLDEAGRAALEADLAALRRDANEAPTDDEVIVHAGILEVRATRA